MARVFWTAEARDRLDAIVAYIAQDSPQNALKVENGIIQASRRMETLPYGGGIAEELKEYGVREIYYGAYRILYVIKDGACYEFA